MRRVVITGLGVVTPIGNDLESMWSALIAGRSGAAPTSLFDVSALATKISCEVKQLDTSQWVDKRDLKHIDRFLQLGIPAALMAVADAGLGSKIPEDQQKRWGSYIGSAFGGIGTIESTYTNVLAKGPRYGFSTYYITDHITNELPGMVAIRVGAQGPNFALASACASGAHAIGEALRAIRHGHADGMIAGGAEAPIGVVVTGGLNAMGMLSTRNDEPHRACRPFDRERDGFVLGEGAGIVVLEELEMAKRRGARIYAEVVGYGSTSDAYHASTPDQTGERECLLQALADAKLDPSQIGYANAHGASTKLGDKVESDVIKAVFGDHAKRLAISSTKSMTGHTLGASGGIETAISVLAMTRNVLPPTINLETPDPECDLDFIPNVARDQRVDAVMSNSFGIGGHNTSLIFRRYDGV